MNRYEYVKRLIDFGILSIKENGTITRKIKFHRNGILRTRERDITLYDKDGYKYIVIRIKKETKSLKVHRLIWCYRNGKIKEGLEVNHKNGKKDDNRIENLEVVTKIQNMRRAIYVTKVFDRKGEKNPNCKLKENDIININIMIKQGIEIKEIAKIYNVHKAHIYHIKNGRYWRHII